MRKIERDVFHFFFRIPFLFFDEIPKTDISNRDHWPMRCVHLAFIYFPSFFCMSRNRMWPSISQCKLVWIITLGVRVSALHSRVTRRAYASANEKKLLAKAQNENRKSDRKISSAEQRKSTDEHSEKRWENLNDFCSMFTIVLADSVIWWPTLGVEYFFASLTKWKPKALRKNVYLREREKWVFFITVSVCWAGQFTWKCWHRNKCSQEKK